MNFKENESVQKLRGGYYTPDDLAQFIARWVAITTPKRILEPSCGDGRFFRPLAASTGVGAAITAFELDAAEAAKAQSQATELRLKASVRPADFLGWAVDQLHNNGERFDAVVGNPPFVRYQYLPENFQKLAEQIFQALGCKFTKHTNAWVPFVLASIALLRPGGRLGMVVPAEIIHVMHAQSLRSYLGKQCKKIVVIDPQQLWFEETLQGAVILLAETRASAKQKQEGLGILPVQDREFVTKDANTLFRSVPAINGKTIAGKWTTALLDTSTRNLLDELLNDPQVHRFKEIAQVDVGIVTGANKYFLVPDKIVEDFGLQSYAHPMFGRSDHCPGIIYDHGTHKANTARGLPTNFIWFKDESVINDSLAQAYIDFGEQQKLHTRYKCRVRTPWYSVPSVYSTEIGMLKRSHHVPRLILNKAKAFTTDTAYRVRSCTVSAQRLVSCFINPVTALSAELEGRSYGGGVLELVPSEIERLIVPLPASVPQDIRLLDKLIQEKPTPEVLMKNGGPILSQVGLTGTQQEELLDSWRKLRNRRQRIGPEASPR